MTNIHESQHPSLKTKVSKLRDPSLSSTDVAKLCGEISAILASEATTSVLECSTSSEQKTSAAGVSYPQVKASPSSTVLVPILRSGLAMVDAYSTALPESDSVPVFHLGLYREKATLSPVEYYNKLPKIQPGQVGVAFVVDPVVATGGTADAVIQTLKEWGASKIVFNSIVASKPGLQKVAQKHPEVDFFVGQLDDQLSDTGFILPGVGDIGDRLYCTF